MDLSHDPLLHHFARQRDRGAWRRRYRAVFSIVSAAAMVWLVVAYKSAPYVATWGIPEWWKPIAIILMLPAFLLSVIGLTTPDPTSVG